MDDPVADAVRDLAPGGVLRAAINEANPLLVTGRGEGGDPIGLAPTMARLVAERLDVGLQLIPFPSPGSIADRAADGEWDIALIGSDPARARSIAFSPAYVEINATYLVSATSTVPSVEAADSAGNTIVAVRESAYGLWLDAHLQDARVFAADDDAAALAAFLDHPDYLLAGLAPTLRAYAVRQLGTLVLPGRFMAVQQAIGIGLGREAGSRFLRDFVLEARRSGDIQRLLAEFGVESKLSVASD